jgi:c-di-GMP-related signal transduction protein
MNKFPDSFLHPFDRFRRDFNADHRGTAPHDNLESRQFTLQTIVGPNKQAFGMQAHFRAGWEDDSAGDPNTSSRILVDNWLLYGFDELSERRPVFLKCSRNTLLSGFLSLLPRSAVFEIQESMEPDPDVISAWESLREAGYRFALDDFESPEKMEPFLHLASFIKVGYRYPERRERAPMLRRLRLTGASLIAEQIECEEEFQSAREDGYGLFQGAFLGESIRYVKKRDTLDPICCMRILEELQQPEPNQKNLAKLIGLQSGIECRLLRRANWVTPRHVVINTIQEALEIVEPADIRNLITLAMAAAVSRDPVPAASLNLRPSLLRNDVESFGRWNEASV